MTSLYRISLLRKFILPILQRFDFDIEISHPWVRGVKVKLNSFQHKGYWYHGKSREHSSMLLFGLLVQPGFTVVEAGGHIGFISLYLASLVGRGGKVFVFEPGINNLPYIKHNLSQSDGKSLGQIILIEAAVGERNGTVAFFEESLTGQNNSVIADFQGLKRNRARSYVESSIYEREVKLISLDSYFSNDTIDFIKIDIEGYEWFALQGASDLIQRNRPGLMVEIQANQREIFEWFQRCGYMLFSDDRIRLERWNDLTGNVFCLHKEKHIHLLEKLKLQ